MGKFDFLFVFEGVGWLGLFSILSGRTSGRELKKWGIRRACGQVRRNLYGLCGGVL